MAYSTDSSGCSMTATYTELSAWPQMPPFKQPMPGGRSPRHFSIAVFVSVVLHAILAFLLWVTVTDHMIVEPAPPSIDKPLIVTLVSSSKLAVDPYEVRDRKPESAAPQTSPPDQSTQPSPEQKVKTETVMASKDQGIPNSEIRKDKSLINDTAPSVDLEDTHRIAREDGKLSMSVIDAASVMSPKDLEFPGLKALDGEFLGTGGTPSFSLEASYGIAREVGRMSMSAYEVQESRFKTRKLYLKNHLGIVLKPLPYCGTVYSGMGYLAIPFFLKNAITKSDCTWEKSAVLEKQKEAERQKDEERLDTYKSTINEFLFSP